MTVSSSHAATVAPATRWTAYVLTVLDAAFLLFDAIGKFMQPQPVIDAFNRLGMPLNLAPAIGALLAILTVLYLIPRTRVLGSVLLTGYLGGAVAVQMRAGSAAFETTFPIIIGVLVWIPAYLLDARARALISLTR